VLLLQCLPLLQQKTANKNRDSARLTLHRTLRWLPENQRFPTQYSPAGLSNKGTWI